MYKKSDVDIITAFYLRVCRAKKKFNILDDGKVIYSGNNHSRINLSVLDDQFITEACGGYEFSAFVTQEGDIYV